MEYELKVKLLKDFKNILDKHSIEFFPTGGTFLGLYRDGKILPWDADMDFGVWHTDFDKLVKTTKDFEKLGYKVHFAEGRYQHCSICLKEDFGYYENRPKYETVNGDKIPFHAGVSFWVKDKDHAIQLRFFDNNLFDRLFGRFKERIKNKYLLKIFIFLRRFYNAFILHIKKLYVYPVEWFDDLDTINAHGIDITIMSNPEKYCEMMYGPYWKEPVKEWDKKKHLKVTRFLMRYNIKDTNVKDLWIKRGE